MEEVHTVYRIGDDGRPTTVSIKEVAREFYSGKSRESIIAGGLFCSHEGRMTFAIPEERQSYFRHVGKAGGGEGGASFGCGCSSKHRRAQELLRDHDYSSRVEFVCFRECKRHTFTVFVADAACKVELEVREVRAAPLSFPFASLSRHSLAFPRQVNDSNGRFITDVLYRRGEELHRVEVWNKHKTSPESRSGREYVEVRCDHVLEDIESGTLKCEFASMAEHCPVCEAEAKAEAEAKERERKRALWREKKRKEEERKRAAREAEEALERSREAERQRQLAEEREDLESRLQIESGGPPALHGIHERAKELLQLALKPNAYSSPWARKCVAICGPSLTGGVECTLCVSSFTEERLFNGFKACHPHWSVSIECGPLTLDRLREAVVFWESEADPAWIAAEEAAFTEARLAREEADRAREEAARLKEELRLQREAEAQATAQRLAEEAAERDRLWREQEAEREIRMREARERRAEFEAEERQEKLERQRRIDAQKAAKAAIERKEKAIRKVVGSTSSRKLSRLQEEAKRMFKPR